MVRKTSGYVARPDSASPGDRWLVWLAVFGCLIFASAGARADGCDSLPLPKLTLIRTEEAPTLNTSYSYKEITVLGSSEHQPTRRLLGLTRGTAAIHYTVRTQSLVDRSARWECVSPQIEITYGFKPMLVYVANEFPQGSCAFNEIYQHELRHVKTNVDHLASIERELYETLNQRFATGAPWRGPVGQSRELISKEMQERWIPYIKRQIDRVKEAQALIDTPEEYTRVSDSCGGTIRKAIH